MTITITITITNVSVEVLVHSWLGNVATDQAYQETCRLYMGDS